MALELTKQIKNDYGTLKHYALKKKINYGTLRLVIAGREKTKDIIKILKQDGYLR